MAQADTLVNSGAAGIPRFGPGTQIIGRRRHRGIRQILRPQDAETIVRLAIDHYVSGRPGEISRAVARRSHFSQEIVDGVLVAALLTVQGHQDVRRHCDRLAIEMAAEREQDTRAEFQEWMKRRVAS